MAEAYDTCNQKSGYHKHDAVSDALISGGFFSVFCGCDSKVGTAETYEASGWNVAGNPGVYHSSTEFIDHGN